MNFRNLILVLALVLLSVFAAGERVTQRFGECASCDVKGVASDSIVKSTQPALNFGSDATIYYRSLSPSLEARALMRFDLNSIPSGARVYSAKLRFFSNTDSLTDKPEGKIGIKQPIYALTDSSGTGVWVESQATFNNKAAQIPWSSQGDITTAIGSQAGFVYFKNWVAGSQAYYDVELAGIVQSWVNLPSSNLGLYIPTGPYYNKSFISKENPRADLRPYLEVAFEGTNSESIPLPSDIQAKFHNGQTFITWKEAVTDKNETSYRIYRYTQPIISSNINTAELLDQVYQGSSYFTDMTLNGIGGTTIKQPDLSPAGVSLGPDSGLYVYPVENSQNSYYAVTTVVEGNEKQQAIAGQNATVSPLPESPGIPDAFFFQSQPGYAYYTGYVMWLGTFNPENPSDQYGFSNFRSMPVFFSVTKPHKIDYSPQDPNDLAGFIPGQKFPLTVHLHAAMHNYFDSGEGVDNSRCSDSYCANPPWGGFSLGFNDQSMVVFKDKTGNVVILGRIFESVAKTYPYTYYSAYNSNYAPSQLGDGTRPIGYELNVGIPKTFKELKPFEEGKSVPYGEKQMAFIIKWMQNQSKWSQFIDSSKVYFQGGSLGGGGSMTFALHYPELVSAIDAIQGKVVNYFIDPSTGAGSYPGGMENYLGPFSENIPTPEGIGIYDYVDAGKYFLAHPEKDFPVIRTNHGKNDLLAWYQVPAFYSAANSARVYIYSVFDQCAHNCFEASYFPEYIPVRNFVVNMFNDGFNIFHYSLSKSYPAFSDFSLNSNPGNGVPASGDLRGGINRYPYWDWNTGLETSRQYDVNVFLMAESPLDSATVSITPRRLQALEHSAGTAYFWKNIRVSDGQVLQSGNVSADQYGRITIQNFIISKQKSTLSMVVGNSPPAQCFDLTGDNKVDLFDLVFVSLRLGSPAGSPADVIGNDGVNILDLQEVSRNFGQNC